MKDLFSIFLPVFPILMPMSFFLSCSHFHPCHSPPFLPFLVSQFDFLSGNGHTIRWGNSLHCRLKNKGVQGGF